jgi:hypothetical protein
MTTQDQMNQAVERGYAQAHARLTDLTGSHTTLSAAQARKLAAESRHVSAAVAAEQAAAKAAGTATDRQVLDWTERLAASPWQSLTYRWDVLRDLNELDSGWVHYPLTEARAGDSDPYGYALPEPRLPDNDTVAAVDRSIHTVELHDKMQRKAPWALDSGSAEQLTITLTPEQATHLRTAVDAAAQQHRRALDEATRELAEPYAEGEYDDADLANFLEEPERDTFRADTVAWMVHRKLDAAERPADTYEDVRDRQRTNRPSPAELGAHSPSHPANQHHQPPARPLRSFLVRMTGMER